MSFSLRPTSIGGRDREEHGMATLRDTDAWLRELDATIATEEADIRRWQETVAADDELLADIPRGSVEIGQLAVSNKLYFD